MSRRPLLAAVTLLALLAAASALRAQEDADGGPAEDAAGYAATPAALRPYGPGTPMYWRYFEQPTRFTGTGRDKPAPGDLSSVKLGLIAPAEGGRDADVGRSMRRGVTLCIEQANARGGFGGLPFEVVLREDAGAWGDSSNTLVDLAYEERVWAVIGSVDPASTHVALRVALKAEMPMVNTACTDPTLTETAIPWILRCYPDDRQHGYRLARHVFEERDLERVAVLRANDKYGRMGVAEFVAAARRLGRPVVTEVRYNAGERDFSAQFERITGMRAEAIVLWSDTGDAAAIVRALHDAGMDLPVFGADRLVCNAFLKEAGAAAESVSATTALDPAAGGEAWEAFRADYEQRFGEEPDAFAAYGYDGTAILLDAIGRAGLNRALIRDELAALRGHDGVSGPMRFDPTHNNLGTIRLVQVQGGRFVALDGH